MSCKNIQIWDIFVYINIYIYMIGFNEWIMFLIGHLHEKCFRERQKEYFIHFMPSVLSHAKIELLIILKLDS